MLKKILAFSLFFSLAACAPGDAPNTPGAGDGNGDGSNASGTVSGDLTVSSVTKAQYLQLLDCAIARSELSAEQKVGLENVKTSVRLIPDAQWNAIAAGNPGFATQLQLAVQQGCSL